MRYYWLSALSFLIAAPLADFATPPIRWHEMRVKHTWNAVPDNWESLGHPAASTTIDLYIALEPHHEHALIDALYKVSDPSHPRYGAHLSKEHVAELVRPHPDTLELVSSWLAHYGVRSSSITLTHGGAWLTVTDVLVSQANDLLGASYRLYRHTKTNETIIRTVGYSIPTVLYAHIQTVVPTTYFASTRILQQTPRRPSFGGDPSYSDEEATPRNIEKGLSSRDKHEVTPSFLTWQYQTFAYTPTMTTENALGIMSFNDQYANQADLNQFMAEYSTIKGGGPPATFNVVPLNGGGNNPSDPGEEATVNIQYASALTYPTPITFYSIGGTGKYGEDGQPLPGDAFLEWFNYMIHLPKVPQTISISYANYEKELPLTYAKALCSMFSQLGARGISILVASGNEGVGKGDCKDSSGNVRFVPEFPSTCPEVTSVGGTTNEREIATRLSGGGFSNHFERPPYQDGAVKQFLQNLGDKYAGLFNSEGRAYPDISAQALNFGIVYKGAYRVVKGGTSCSAPTAASVISLLNDYRISNGMDPLGFLNPWIYSYGRIGFNDIKSGSNPGCDTIGFSAIRGWDPVTGVGTPDFEKLQKTFEITGAGSSGSS